MKRSLLTFIAFLCFFGSVRAQGRITIPQQTFSHSLTYDSVLANRLNSSAAISNLSKLEQESLYWINFVRLHPRAFASEIITPFLNQFPQAKGSYANSLLKTLQTISPSPYITPDIALNKLALGHASDLGKTGHSISHASSTGENFQQRMTKAGFTSCIAENIFEGKQDALETIILLLIDKGVPNVGHRKNILDPNMTKIGVSYYPIKGRSGYFFHVQNFSCATQ